MLRAMYTFAAHIQLEVTGVVQLSPLRPLNETSTRSVNMVLMVSRINKQDRCERRKLRVPLEHSVVAKLTSISTQQTIRSRFQVFLILDTSFLTNKA